VDCGAGGTKEWPSVYIGIIGVIDAVSPKSYMYSPRVSVGQASGSAATKRVFLPLTKLSRSSGSARPAKFEPPPAQPMTTSGYSPAISICLIDSWPITVWCRRTWLSTEPSE